VRARSFRLLVLAAALTPVAIGAQSAPQPAPPVRSATGDVEEILVTITKSDEKLADVPASVSAFGAEDVTLAGIASSSDVASLLPNVVTKGESRTGNFSIRGVSESFSSQSPVAYHLDGSFRPRLDSLLGQFYDLESVELVRGPSGTVYGRNATAGAIDLRHVKPHPDYEVLADALTGNYRHVQLRGVVYAPPLGAGDERLMARLSLQRDVRDGYVNDLTGRSRRRDPHNADDWASRLTLRSLPRDGVELTLRASYAQSDADPYTERPLVDSYTRGFLDTRVFDANGNLTKLNFGVVGFDPYHGYPQLVSDLTDVVLADSNGDPDVHTLRLLANLLSPGPGASRADVEQVVLGLVMPSLIADPSQVGHAAQPIPRNPLKTRSDAYRRHQTSLEVYGVEGALAWDFSPPALGDVRLDLHFGWEHTGLDQVVDADGSELPILDVFRPQRVDLHTGELRLASRSDSAFDWIAGLFYFRQTLLRHTDEVVIPFGTIVSDVTEVTTGFAPFARVELHPLAWLAHPPAQDVTLFGGWRLNRDSIDLHFQNLLTPTSGGLPLPLQRDTSVFEENTWEAGVRWQPSERHTVYLKYAKGYKTGTLEADSQTGEIHAVRPELIRGWELGVKSELWDGRVLAALTGFWSSYTDLQVPQVIGLTQRTLNAAEASLRGVELELRAAPAEGLTLQASAGFLDARFDRFCSDDAAQRLPVSDPGCPASNPLFPWQGQSNLAGHALEDAPRWKAAALASYRVDLGAWGTLTPVLKLTWTDHYWLRPYALPTDRVDAYTRTDLRLVWQSEDERLSVEAYAENLEDEIVYARLATTAEFTGSFPASLGLLPPRTYGVRVGFHWKRD
jgi:iron complex outermembrane receptor protein